jgi:two-component system nitrate/nitrite response regulator NarL
LRIEMTGTSTVRVLIAEPHPLYRDAVARVIHRHAGLQLVGEFGDGRRALAELVRLQPEVALVDVALPSLPGDRVLGAVRRRRLPTRVIFLSAVYAAGLAYRLLAEGAAGCLTKGIGPEELGRAIVAAARGEVVLGSDVPATLAQEIRLRHENGRPVLSPREAALLERLADGRSGPAIAQELRVSPATVKTHLAHLYEKLGVNDRAAAVAVGMRRGLLE